MMPFTRRAAAIANARAEAEKDQCVCVKCKHPDHVADMIACDRCHRWYHRTCVDVAESLENRQWTCEDCILTTTVGGGSISGRTSSSTRSSRIQLQLMRLEEEKKAQEKLILEKQEQERLLQEKTLAAKADLDKQYLDEKYALLSAQAEDDEAGSVRSRRSRMSRVSKVQEWIEDVDVAAEGNLVPGNVEHSKVDVATGGNPLAEQVEDTPTAPRNETGLGMGNNGSKGQELTKYTGTIPKLPPIQEKCDNRRFTTNAAEISEADKFGSGSMTGNNAPVRSSTPIRPVEQLPQVTLPKPPLFPQPEHSLPLLRKVVPRPILPKSLFSEPVQPKPPSVHVPVSRPSTSMPQQQLLPQSRGKHPTLFDPKHSNNPRTNVPPLLTQPLLPQQSIPEQSGQQLPPAPPTSSNPPLCLPTNMPPIPIPRPSFGNPLDVPSRPPSVLQEPISYTPPLPYPPEPDRLLPQTTNNQSMPWHPSFEQQQALQQLQNQQAMWGQFQQQLSARQVVPKELPAFSGSPEEWPLFICSYNNSTAMCGYSEAENLMRLQRCLKGRALEAVRSNLLLPSSVPKVMETLETLFGSPERLVQSLLSKVRSVPTPKAERLETLVNFGLVVQNLVGHLKAANQQAHLTNPTLLQELVDKLPPHIRLDWALFKKRAGTVDLGTFGDYMSAITSAASDVAHFSDSDGAHTHRNERQKKKSCSLMRMYPKKLVINK